MKNFTTNIYRLSPLTRNESNIAMLKTSKRNIDSIRRRTWRDWSHGRSHIENLKTMIAKLR